MTTTSPNALPRSRSLTGVLGSPLGRGPSSATLHGLRNRLQWAITSTGTGSRTATETSGPPDVAKRRSGSRVIDGYLIRLAGHGLTRPTEDQFRWSTTTARRTLGLAAVRQCLATGQAPADAAIAVIARRVADGRRDGARPGSLTHWLGSLGPGGRGAVTAEATAWATHLWSALDWPQVDGALSDPLAVVGTPDRWWRPPFTSTRTVALRGRADVRWFPSHGRSSLLNLLPGRPGPTWKAELGLAALIDIFDRPDAAPPGRVAGIWPQAGRTLVIDVDLALLDETTGWVQEALRLMGQRAGEGAGPEVAEPVQPLPWDAQFKGTAGVAA